MSIVITQEKSAVYYTNPWEKTTFPDSFCCLTWFLREKNTHNVFVIVTGNKLFQQVSNPKYIDNL